MNDQTAGQTESQAANEDGEKQDVYYSSLVNTDFTDGKDDMRPAWADVGARFGSSAANRTDIDIYQMCAFLSMNEPIKLRRYFYYLKAIICALVQTIGISIYLYTILHDSESAECNTDFGENWKLRFLSFLLASFISCKIGGLLRNVSDKSLYHMNFYTYETCPPFVNHYWVLIGGYVNVYALSVSVIASFCIIFLSDTMLDVILNGVALFFVIDLDDFMLDSGDFDRILKFFNDKDGLQTKYPISTYCHWKKDPPTSIEKVIFHVTTFGTICLMFGTIGAGCLAPFWILICKIGSDIDQ